MPIVEPEVLMDGSHTIERCEDVTSSILHAVFHALFEQCVGLEGMLLKPSMVIAGKDCPKKASVAGGCNGHVALLAPSCAGGGSRHCISVGRAKRRPGDVSSECDQQARSAETVEDQFFLRAGASGSRDRSLAWQAREPESRTASVPTTGRNVTAQPPSANTPAPWKARSPFRGQPCIARTGTMTDIFRRVPRELQH